MDKNKIFSFHTHDIGVDKTSGRSLDDVNTSFLYAPFSDNKCIVCGNSTASLQLVPKPHTGLTVHSPEQALVCRHCVRLFNPEHYYLKEIPEDKGNLL